MSRIYVQQFTLVNIAKYHSTKSWILSSFATVRLSSCPGLASEQQYVHRQETIETTVPLPYRRVEYGALLHIKNDIIHSPTIAIDFHKFVSLLSQLCFYHITWNKTKQKSRKCIFASLQQLISVPTWHNNFQQCSVWAHGILPGSTNWYQFRLEWMDSSDTVWHIGQP